MSEFTARNLAFGLLVAATIAAVLAATVLLTHLDSDHRRGLLDALDTYDVGATVSGSDSPESTMYAQWQGGVARNDVEVLSVHQDYSLDLGSGVAAEVLSPPFRLYR